MDQNTVYVYAQLLAALAKMEAMKLDNEIRKMEGNTTFNYSPEAFYELANEIQSIFKSIIPMNPLKTP